MDIPPPTPIAIPVTVHRNYKLVINLKGETDTLFIVFSHTINRPLLAKYPFPGDVIHVMDRRVIFHLGNPVALAAYLRTFIEAGKYRKICFLGTSKGAYAAILFGASLARPLKDLTVGVLAFSPQTLLYPLNPDLPYPSYREMLERAEKEDPRLLESLKNYGDLRSRLTRQRNLRITVVFGKRNPIDSVGAERLRECRSVRLMGLNFGEHNTILPFVTDMANPDEIYRRLYHLRRNVETDEDFKSVSEIDVEKMARPFLRLKWDPTLNLAWMIEKVLA